MTLHATSDAGSSPGDEGGVPPGAHGRVFFSYARSDAAFVLKIASALRADGVELWVDQLDIPKGARWDESVEGALKGCSCLVVVLSPASVNSFNVLDEVYYTLGEEKRVVPILLQACEIPFRLKRIQYIDFTAGYQEGYEELLATLTQRPAQHRPPPPPHQPPHPPEPPEPPETEPAGHAGTAGAGPGPGPQRTGRGSTIKHVALGGALMFFVLTIIGLVTQTGKDEPVQETPQPVTPPVEPPVQPPGTEPAHAVPGAQADPGVPADSSAAAPTGTGPVPVWPPGSAGADPAATGTGPVTQPIMQPSIDTAPPAVQAPPPPEPAPAPAPEPIAEAALPSFVASFIGAHNRRDLGQILAHYDNGVDYLGAGQGKQFVARDKRSMYAGWTSIQFRLGSKIEYQLSNDGQAALVNFIVEFDADNAGAPHQGRVREEMRLRMVDGALKITAERQTTVP